MRRSLTSTTIPRVLFGLAFALPRPQLHRLSRDRDRLARRAILALAMVIPSVSLVWQCDALRGQTLSDFGLVWAAAGVLARGGNPYALIGPTAPISFQFPFNYPLPAAVLARPFALLPAHAADALFAGLGAAALAWALTRQRLANPQLCVFASAGFGAAVANVQWSPLLTATALLPSAGVLFACKPTVGLAYLIAYPSRRAVISAGLLALLTTLIWPWWIPAWLTILRTQTHIMAPVTFLSAGGPLLLLALTRWRRPEARLLVAFACIPHSIWLYETVALFLIVETWAEGIGLVLLTILLWLQQPAYISGDFTAWMVAGARWQIALMYLPCLLLVLRRPNVWPAARLDIETPVLAQAA